MFMEKERNWMLQGGKMVFAMPNVTIEEINDDV
jgi:hypothetical protein